MQEKKEEKDDSVHKKMLLEMQSLSLSLFVGQRL